VYRATRELPAPLSPKSEKTQKGKSKFLLNSRNLRVCLAKLLRAHTPPNKQTSDSLTAACTELTSYRDQRLNTKYRFTLAAGSEGYTPQCRLFILKTKHDHIATKTHEPETKSNLQKTNPHRHLPRNSLLKTESTRSS
jgi:hypothetical protein